MLSRTISWRRAAVGAAAVAVTIALAPGIPAEAEPVAAKVPTTVASGSDACGDLRAKPSGGTWSCTFVDDFEGSGRPGTVLDDDKWLVGETSWSGFTVGATCLTASPKNVVVRSGALRLTARDEGETFTCESPSGDFDTRYTGGHISTRGNFSQTYGRFEVRAKFPTARSSGVHGGFWMYPASHTYGPWPQSGEIDVAEWWSSEPTMVVPSLHYPDRNFWADSGWWCRIADVSEFHTYSVEWNEAGLRFFQDGEQCFQRIWDEDDSHPFDHPFNLVLTMGVGPKEGNNAVSSDTPLPGEFIVDYVKAWE